LLEAAAHDFDYPHVVDVEVYGVLWENGQDRLCNKVGKEVFIAGLLCGDDGSDGFTELLL
jgi:NADPH:quinone reductase-like Zn-dependent oxidoreductase